MVWSPQRILERLLPKANAANKPSPSATSPAPASRQLYTVYYDEKLKIVEKEAAVYALHFYNGVSLEWKLLAGTPEDTAHFSIESYVFDWGEEQWANFPLNIATELIPGIATDPNCRCGFGLQWIKSSWPERYHLFLSTHRSSLDQYEKVLFWLAYALASDNQTLSRVSWSIALKQSDLAPINPFLWSQITRDFTLNIDGQPLEFTDKQIKLLRLIHCYFMPFHVEAIRRHHVRVAQWEKEALWRIEVPTPSQHERLEASLNLREWLKGKASPETIASLLL